MNLLISKQSKPQEVTQYLRRQILTGAWHPGDKIPSEKELTDALNISQRAIREAVLNLANEGLLIRQQGRGTFVAQNPQAVTISILCASYMLQPRIGFFYYSLLEALGRKISEHNYRPSVALGLGTTPEEVIASSQVLNYPVNQRPAGVINLVPNTYYIEKDLNHQGINSVCISAEVPFSPHSILLNYTQAAQMANQVMTKHGHSDFMVMCVEISPHTTSTCQETIAYINESVAGFDPNRLVYVPWTPNFEMAGKVFEEIWNSPRRPRSIFLFDDCLTEMLLPTIQKLGIRVPEDLAILTEACSKTSFAFPIPLTAIEFDVDEIASAAWTLLQHQIEHSQPAQSIIRISPNLREGQSL